MRSGKVFRDVDLQLLFDLLVAYRAMYNISGTPAAQRQVLAWQHKDFNTCIPAACARNVHIKIIRQSQRYCDQSASIHLPRFCLTCLFFGNGFIKYDKSNETKGGTNGWGEEGEIWRRSAWGEMGEDGWSGMQLVCSHRLVVLLFTTRIDARLSRSIFQAAGNLTPRTVRQPHPSTKLHTYKVPKATTARSRPRRSPYT